MEFQEVGIDLSSAETQGNSIVQGQGDGAKLQEQGDERDMPGNEDMEINANPVTTEWKWEHTDNGNGIRNTAK